MNPIDWTRVHELHAEQQAETRRQLLESEGIKARIGEGIERRKTDPRDFGRTHCARSLEHLTRGLHGVRP